MRSNALRLICWLVLSMASLAALAEQPSFEDEEDLGYEQFICPTYPDGLRAPWGGVSTSYLETHLQDDPSDNKGHEVSSESTSLLAQLALLHGDRAKLDEMIAYGSIPTDTIPPSSSSPNGSSTPTAASES